MDLILTLLLLLGTALRPAPVERLLQRAHAQAHGLEVLRGTRVLMFGDTMVNCGLNVWLAPWLGFDVAYRRPGEGRFGGLVSYPLAVLLLLLLAPLEVAAGGWIVMATVDPIAAAVGSRWPRPRVPFHRRKSMVGTVAGFLGGWVGASLLLAWMNAPHAPVAGACAAAAGALAEVLPLPVDDNLPVAAAASLALLPWIL